MVVAETETRFQAGRMHPTIMLSCTVYFQSSDECAPLHYGFKWDLCCIDVIA